MTPSPDCETFHEAKVALLYDDGDVAERSRARNHLAQCVSCRADYAELKGVRHQLEGWRLPEPAFVAAPKPRVAFRWLPAGLAAAAGLVLGIGVTTAGRGVLPLLTGAPSAPSQTAEAPSPAAVPGSGQFVSYNELRDLLEAQESRHLSEIAELRQSLAEISDLSAPEEGRGRAVSNLSTAAVQRLLQASEARQTKMVEARLAGLRTQNELQRQYDLAQISAGLAYIDSRTGADAARTSELMKNLVRVTAKPQDR